MNVYSHGSSNMALILIPSFNMMALHNNKFAIKPTTCNPIPSQADMLDQLINSVVGCCELASTSVTQKWERWISLVESYMLLKLKGRKLWMVTVLTWNPATDYAMGCYQVCFLLSQRSDWNEMIKTMIEHFL